MFSLELFYSGSAFLALPARDLNGNKCGKVFLAGEGDQE